jgi:glycosyltransferase involved in cell wall biosynthesis
VDIVFFAHPAFLKLRSMDRFTELISSGLRTRGHKIRIWRPKALFSRLPAGKQGKKWLGYLDQFLLFPLTIQMRMSKHTGDTLYVFTDQALGPWVPLVKNRKHIIHCHDFLALQSASGLVPENITGWTGKKYQSYIKWGFSQGKNFICVSKKTNRQLQGYLTNADIRTEMVYNGLNKNYRPIDQMVARKYLERKTRLALAQGYIMHVGGNQWYKNRKGVIEIYNAWRLTCKSALPLLLIGEHPSVELSQQVYGSTYRSDIYVLADRDDEFIRNAYSGACLLLFPSLAEGFGWPIAEAMACGCQVITTNQAPMTEVGATAAFYIDRRPLKNIEVPYWANAAADLMEDVITAPETVRQHSVKAGLQNSRRFSEATALDKIEQIYFKVIQDNSL